MSDSPEADDNTLDLRPWVENWWNRSKNPLYAWEAIARSLNSGEPIPEWATAYLREVANNMLTLAHGRDFRKSDAPRIAPDEAGKLVGEALGLSRERAKNAFERRSEDAQTARAALDEDFHGRARAIDQLKKHRNIEQDRAGRLLSAGRKLNKPFGRK